MTSTSSHITNSDEVALFNKLLPDHTRGTKTNWDTMARAFNDEVIHSLQVPDSQLSPKTAKQLAHFDRTVAKRLCQNQAMSMMTAINAASNQQAHPLSPPVQHLVSALDGMMAAARVSQSQGQQNMDPQAGASGAPSEEGRPAPPPPAYVSQFRSRAKEEGGQGMGQKSCGGCGWRAKTGEKLTVHRAGCAAYIAKQASKEGKQKKQKK